MIKVILAESPYQKKMTQSIRKRVFVDEQQVSLEDELEGDDESIHFLAEKEGLPVGAGRYRVKAPFLKIERLATLPEARGKGVATEMMLFMQALGAVQYPDLLQLIHAQIDVLLFYKKLGWISIGAPFDECGINHQLMILLPKSKEILTKLKCLTDPTCPKEILDFLKQE